MRIYHSSGAHDRRVFNRVLELSHVAGPAEFVAERKSLSGDPLDRIQIPVAHFIQEPFNQDRDIAPTIPERRKGDGYCRET